MCAFRHSALTDIFSVNRIKVTQQGAQRLYTPAQEKCINASHQHETQLELPNKACFGIGVRSKSSLLTYASSPFE